MGDSICLQPWLTISGNGNTVLQEEAGWVEIDGYQGVAIYTEVAFVTDQTGQTSLDIQTSATREEVFFGALAGGSANPWVATYTFATSPALGVQPLKIRRWSDGTTSTTPPQRLLRWRLRFPAASTACTFRIWLNLLQNAGAGAAPR
jgi:hypothetical protein